MPTVEETADAARRGERIEPQFNTAFGRWFYRQPEWVQALFFFGIPVAMVPLVFFFGGFLLVIYLVYFLAIGAGFVASLGSKL